MKCFFRVVASFAAFLLLLQSVLPAYAVSESYYLSVDGVDVSSDNLDDILGDGSASYDPSNNVLTLKGASITQTRPFAVNGKSYHAAIGCLNDLTIELIGDSSITVYGYSMYSSKSGMFINGNLKIIGSGTLTIYGDEYTKHGIRAKSVSVKDATLDIGSSDCGIRSEVLEVESGTVIVDSREKAVSVNELDLVKYEDHAVVAGEMRETAALYYSPLAELLKDKKYVQIGRGHTISLKKNDNGLIQVDVENNAELGLNAKIYIAIYTESGKMIDVRVEDVVCPAGACLTVDTITIEGKEVAKVFMVEPDSYQPICVWREWSGREGAKAQSNRPREAAV